MKIYASRRPEPKFEDFEGKELWVRVKYPDKDKIWRPNPNKQFYMRVLTMNGRRSWDFGAWYSGAMKYNLLEAEAIDSELPYWDTHELCNWEFMLNHPYDEACSATPDSWEICTPVQVLTTEEIDEHVHNMPRRDNEY
jgi:hypothetical protein